jgi:1-aminocyclopropane-1-carboxylate deaminase
VNGGLALRLPSELRRLHDDRLGAVRLWLKRDDLIHPDLPGNKWRKLNHNLAAARRAGAGRLLTFGGAYSNHIRATAAAGRIFGFETIGVIRGEEHSPLNPSLAYAVEQGMTLTYLDRDRYRRKTDPEVVAGLVAQWGEFYLLPEGGSNGLAARGCAELAAELPAEVDLVCCPCGTGGTLAGIAAGLRPHQRALGFAALKGAAFLAAEVRRLQRDGFGAPTDNWSIEHGYHFGGFARRTPELAGFIDDFARRHGLVLEPVYVAKMLYGIVALAEAGAFGDGQDIVAVITG